MGLRRNLAVNMRRIRMERGISQEEFADLVDLHRTYITQIEGEKRSPTIDVVERIAKRLDLTVVDLLCDPPRRS